MHDIPASSVLPGEGTSANRFLPRLQTLRGCGCIMVAMFHAKQALSGADRNGLAFRAYDIVFNGGAAVTMFFVLSGFVLFLSLERGPQSPAPAATRFTVARVLRIYLPVIGNLALLYILFRFFGATIPGVTAAHYAPLSLVRNGMLLETSINGVMWSVQLEVLAVPLIFAGYFIFRRLARCN